MDKRFHELWEQLRADAQRQLEPKINEKFNNQLNKEVPNESRYTFYKFSLN